MSTSSRPSYFELTATLDITHKDGGNHELPGVLAWLNACLNSNVNFAEVAVLQPTSRLGWPDFLDAPTFGPEHPDYPAAAEILDRVEHWLKLDRKQLISALQAQHLAAQHEKYLQETQAKANALNANKADALDTLIAELKEAGFGDNESINGGDCVEMIDQIYQRLVKQFPG